MRFGRLAGILLSAVSCAVTAAGQTTIIFQPDSACGKDALVSSLLPDTNRGDHTDFIASAWTNQGNPSNLRALIDFDFAALPGGVTIQQATLDLYHYPSPYNTGHSNLSGPADCWLERIVQPWQEHTVTWNTQPATTAVNRLSVAAPVSMTQNYSLNVTQLVQDIVNDPQNSFGFMLRLQNESYYRSLLFASSDHPAPQIHPRLSVIYTPDSLPSAGCWTLTILPQDSSSSNPATPDPQLVFPNIFSPNADGINDQFFPLFAPPDALQLRIYDRWGAEVFASSPALPWNGRNKNDAPCSDGTYYFIFEYSDTKGLHEQQGFFQLIR